MNLLDRLKNLLEEPSPQETVEPDLNLATAILLFEVVWADHDIHAAELAQLRASLTRTIDLDEADVDLIIEDARSRQETHVGVFEYTRLVNEQSSAEQKFELVTNLWRIAYADGRASAIEEHTIRRLSELLYLPHRDFIRAKQRARNDQPAA